MTGGVAGEEVDEHPTPFQTLPDALQATHVVLSG